MSDVITTGIVISSMPIGEYDRRLEILTAQFGRISVFARGARRPSSDLVSVSRVFAAGTFELFQGKNSYSLKSAKIMDYFEDLTSDIELTYYGFYFLELCRYFSRENVESGQMLNLVYLSLKALGHDRICPRLIRSIYELKMLKVNGLCPDPSKITDPLSRYSTGKTLSRSACYAIEYVISAPLQKLYTFVLSDEVLDEFTDSVSHLMSYFVDKQFKTLELL